LYFLADGDYLAYTRHEPLGVCGAIIPVSVSDCLVGVLGNFLFRLSAKGQLFSTSVNSIEQAVGLRGIHSLTKPTGLFAYAKNPYILKSIEISSFKKCFSSKFFDTFRYSNKTVKVGWQ